MERIFESRLGKSMQWCNCSQKLWKLRALPERILAAQIWATRGQGVEKVDSLKRGVHHI